MRKYPAILLAVLLLLAACSAEIVDNLPEEGPARSTVELILAASGGSNVQVSFAPVAYADGYSYKLGDGEITDIPDTSLSFSDGVYTFTVESSLSNSLTLYARREGHASVVIADETFDLSISDLKPDVYLSVRNADSVELLLASGENEKISYKVEIYQGDSLIGSQLFDSAPMLVTGLDADGTYTLHVSQTMDEENYSTPALVDVPVYTDNINQSIVFTIENDTLKATNVPGETATLFKMTVPGGETVPVLEKLLVTEGSVSVNASQLDSLESGYFAFSSSGANSNVIKYTAPVSVTNVTNYWKSALLEVTFADDVNPDDYSLTVLDIPGASAEIVDGGIKVAGLDSNTADQKVVVEVRSSETMFSTQVSATVSTQSHVGTYQWVGMFAGSNQLSNFKIVVKDAPEDSEMPYYVYFDTTAETGDLDIISANNGEYVGKELRIMPLVDYSAGESGATSSNPVTIRSPGELAKQNTAYLANSNKWNTSGMTPITWYIESDQDDDVKDVVRTVTTSTAMLGIQVKTTTIFSFMEAEIDGAIVPVVKFKNTANKFQNFIKSNSEDQRAQYGDLTESEWRYCWYLQKVEEV